MTNKTITKFFGYSIFIILVISLIRIYNSGYNFWTDSEKIDYAVTGQIGDFIGGIVGTIISIAGFYFLYITFNNQTKSFERERLESKFFNMVNLHRDNVSSLKFDATNLIEDQDSLFVENRLYENSDVFTVIFKQFIICRNELMPFFRDTDKIYIQEYEEQLKKSAFVVKNSIPIYQLAQIDICYSIIFYGLNSEGLLILNELFKKKYKEKFINDILRFVTLKPAYEKEIFQKWCIVKKRNTKGKRNELVNRIYEWRKTKKTTDFSEFWEVPEDYHNKFIKYYEGHQFRLGHYFRHLYQTVKFINQQERIDYYNKYEYIKTLRAQLSTYEQAVLFINSLSEIGKTWEMKPEINNDLKSYSKFDFDLITKYNLIKNLPGDSIYGIHFKAFYNLVEYENENIIKNRNEYH